MINELENPVQKLWQEQPLEGTKMPIEMIRKRAAKFDHKIGRRNLRESIAASFVIVFFSYFIITNHDILFRITWSLFIAGTIWVLIVLHWKGSPKSLPGAMGASSSLEFFRSELERQRDLIKNVWPWYLAPMVPGYIALNVAWASALPHRIRWGTMALFDAVFIAIFVAVWKLNQYGAKCLQRSIDSLPPAGNLE